MNRNTTRQLMVGMFGIAAVGLMAMTQGCSSSDNNNGGAGGKTGAGGGSGDAAATEGGVVKITDPLLTDFTAGATTPLGMLFKFHDTGLADATIDDTGGDLKATFDTGAPSTMYPYVGWGLPFAAVSDLTNFTGIKFTASGTLGAGCSAIQFALGDTEHSSAAPFGTCDPTTNCYPGSKTFTLPPTPGDVTILFADLPTGGPATPAVPAKATGIQWQLQFVPGDAGGSCVGNITIDNIMLVP